MEVCYLLDLLSNFDFNFTLALLISIYNSGMIIFYVWHNICGIDNANVFQHEIYSFIAGIDSGLPHTYARTHTHTQAHSSRALSRSTLPSRQLHAEKDSTRLRSCVSSCSCQQLWLLLLCLLLLCSLLCSSLKRALCRRLFTTLQSHSEAT